MESTKLIKLGNGEIKKMTCTDAYKQFIGCLNSRVKKWVPLGYANGYEYEDMYGKVCVSFVDAYKRYDIEKGCSFTTLLYKCIDNDMQKFFYRLHSVKAMSFNMVINGGSDGNDLTIEDLLSDNIDYADTAINKALLANILKKIKELPEREQMIIKLRFINEKTEQQIANKFKISQAQVSIIIKNILKKIKNSNEFEGEIEMSRIRVPKEELEKYFEDNKNTLKPQDMVEYIVKTYNYAKTTAWNYYWVWSGKNKKKEQPQIQKESILTNDTKTAAPIMKYSNILKPTELKGKIMTYRIAESSFSFKKKEEVNPTFIKFAELDDFITELQELKKVVNE